jgi:YD repeat-containing protein
MAHCPEIVLSEITAEKYQALLATAKAQGLDLSGVTGSTNYQGMDFTWTYDAAGQSLTIQCTEKPIFVPCGMIESRIRALIA